MYYITNQTSQIVAIDPELLSLLGLEGTDIFYKKSALGEIAIDLIEERANITYNGKIHSFDATVHPLSGILGEITLVSLTEADTSAGKEEDDEISLDLDEASSLSLIDEIIEEAAEEESIDHETIKATEETAKAEESKIETSSEEMISLDEIDLFDTGKEEPEKPSEEETVEVQTSEETLQEEDELFDLILPEDETSELAKIETESADTTPPVRSEEDIRPIYVDIASISEKIGISTDDYNLFLDEYIDTALTFEEALQSNNEKEKSEALNTLSHLSNVLHLPYVGDLLEQIQNATADTKEGAIAAFFSALGRLSTAQFEEEKSAEAMIASIEEAEKRAEETTAEIIQEADEAPSEALSLEKKIDLSDVTPIHFDFQLEEAAKDLSLPVELIEEFVNDFIEQAHEETEKMIEAYEKGDLETIQKIGHLLKGTSSNLRITPLSETLYEIQFNEDIERVPELVRHYWGHFLSLENQIKLISK